MQLFAQVSKYSTPQTLICKWCHLDRNMWLEHQDNMSRFWICRHGHLAPPCLTDSPVLTDIVNKNREHFSTNDSVDYEKILVKYTPGRNRVHFLQDLCRYLKSHYLAIIPIFYLRKDVETSGPFFRKWMRKADHDDAWMWRWIGKAVRSRDDTPLSLINLMLCSNHAAAPILSFNTYIVLIYVRITRQRERK